MISDDDLLLYHYRDGLDAAERARIGAALSEQPELARRLQTLVVRLDAAAAMPEVPVPAHTQQRWQAALERAQNQEVASDVPRGRRTVPGVMRNVRWQAAAAAVAAVAITLTIQMAMKAPPAPIAEVGTPVAESSSADASAYERGLKWHLASTERQLAGLGGAKPEERAQLIETIVAQNKLYALAAERAGEPQLARVLRAFAPILESLAHDGGENSANVAQLSFELRVMQGRLGAESSAGTSAPSTTL